MALGLPLHPDALIMWKKNERVVAACVCHQSSSKSAVTLSRQYGVHKGTPKFRKIISVFRDSDGKLIPTAIQQYYLIGRKKVDIQLPSHSNSSRHIRPYYRTQPSTLDTIKQECMKDVPAVTYHRLLHNCEDEENSVYQIHNVRKKFGGNHSKDEIFDLIEKLKSHQACKSGGILRDVVIGSTPCAVLASNEQLENIVNICCQSKRFEVLGVDATFELGDIYVTITTFRNLLLINPRTRKPPFQLGPTFIHMERRFEDYYTFFTTLLKHEPRFSSLKAYGTDGEEALVKPLQVCFPSSVSLRCFIHKQRNIEEKLKGVLSNIRNEIMKDIFGVQEGDVFCMGLVCADSFMLALKRLEDRWDSVVKGFYKWFCEKQAENFCKHMISSVRSQLSPVERYTTNSIESANSVVKKWVGFHKSMASVC